MNSAGETFIKPQLREEWLKPLFELADPENFKGAFHLAGGGSKRAYYRLSVDDRSLILQQTENIRELEDYVRIGSFYKSRGVSVPGLLSADLKSGVAIFEDAGDESLESIIPPLLKQGALDEAEDIYRKVIDELALLQCISPEESPEPVRSRFFDTAHYLWESGYFLEKCAGNRFKESAIADPILGMELTELAESLKDEPLCIVHRDFQSQNIHMVEGKPVFLDFQSARLGSCFYDVASLLKDPYVELPEPLHDRLFGYYLEKLEEEGIRQIDSFRKAGSVYRKVSIQRLLQALGAYGKLSLDDGKRVFLKYIPSALRLLNRTLEEGDGFCRLRRLVDQMMQKI